MNPNEKEFEKNYLCKPIELPICPKCKGNPRKNCEICKGESGRRQEFNEKRTNFYGINIRFSSNRI